MKYPVKVAPSVQNLDEFKFVDLYEALDMPGVFINPVHRRSGTSEWTGNVFMFDVNRPRYIEHDAWLGQIVPKIDVAGVQWGGYTTKNDGLRLYMTARQHHIFGKTEYLAIYNTIRAALKIAGVPLDTMWTKGDHWWESPGEGKGKTAKPEDLNWELILGTSYLTVPPPERTLKGGFGYNEAGDPLYQGMSAEDQARMEAKAIESDIKDAEAHGLYTDMSAITRMQGYSITLPLSELEITLTQMVAENAGVRSWVIDKGVNTLRLRVCFHNGATYELTDEKGVAEAAAILPKFGLAHVPNVQAKVDTELMLQWSEVKGSDPYKVAIKRWEDHEQIALTDEERKLVRTGVKAILFAWPGGALDFDGACDGAVQGAVNMLPGCHELPSAKDKLTSWVDYAFAEAPLCLVRHSDQRWQVHAKDEVAIGLGHATEQAAESFRQWLLTQCRARIENSVEAQRIIPDMTPPEVLKRRAPERKRVGGDQDWD